MSEWLRRMRYLLNRGRRDAELAEEMESHRAMAAAEGREQFGDAVRLREEARESWGWMWIDRTAQDLKYAARTLAKAPGFTLAAVLMLAIGIGANVAVFAFFDLMAMSPLPVREPASLLRFERRSADAYAYSLPYGEAAFVARNTRTLSAVLTLTTAKLTVNSQETPAAACFVSANFFHELGAAPEAGRYFDEGEWNGVVLSDDYWRRHFRADPSIAGKTMRLNGVPATIIGVAPREFSGLSLDNPDLWAPIALQPRFVSGSHLLTGYSADDGSVRMWGRLRDGLSPAVAEEELTRLVAELRKSHPADIWKEERLVSQPGGFAMSLRVGDRRGTGRETPDGLLRIAALAVSLTLLILVVACGNLGSLLLARSVAREREIAIRISVGAGRGRLLRQLFTESLLLAGLGSAAGLVLGLLVLRVLLNLTGAPLWLNPTPDWRMLAFAPAAGLVAALFFGLTPALQSARQKHRAHLAARLLVAAQVAASCVLMIVASLLARAMDHASSFDPGFEFRQVLAIDPRLAEHGYTPEKARAFLDRLRDGLYATPGVESVGLTDTPPLGSHVSALRIEVDGVASDILLNKVDPEFFRTMRIPLLSGRNLTRGDKTSVVIGRSLALRQWPAQNPIGRPFLDTRRVAGVTGSARLVRLEDPDMMEAYTLAANEDMPSMTLVARTRTAPGELAPAAARMVREIDPAIFPRVELLTSSFERKLRSTQYMALVVSALGFIANLLACLGILGVVAYAIAQRTKEIGLRMALGARRWDVLLAMAAQLTWPVGAGLVAGAGAAAMLSRMLRQVLYGVSGTDPAAYAGALGLFIATAMLAAYWPVRRALRLDPMRALRQD